MTLSISSSRQKRRISPLLIKKHPTNKKKKPEDVDSVGRKMDYLMLIAIFAAAIYYALFS